jgi:Mn2+/Fe2+ NRAMP family transporter
MNNIGEITLGIMTAMGGFVDVSELVFASQAGSRFLYALIWVFALGTLGIMVYGEMSGRIAAIAKQPVFNLMRQRLGLRTGMIVLFAATIVNVITCSAEIGGVSIVLRLAIGWPYRLLAVLVTLALALIVWLMPFKWIERCFGLLGLFMITFMVTAFALHPPMKEVAVGFIPQIPSNLSTSELLTYCYFVVAIISAVIFPYETYFYSSGAIEEGWSAKDLPVNRLTTIVGFALGSLLAIALLVNSAVLFAPLHIDPQMPGTVALQAAVPFGKTGVWLALAGMLFAIAGAAIETCLCCAYGVCQFFGWEWGRYRGPKHAPRFALLWLATFLIACLIVLSGIRPLDLVEYAVVSSIIVIPFSYLPLLLIANDRKYMGPHVNGKLANVLGWGFYVIAAIAAATAVPLYVLTSGGQL